MSFTPTLLHWYKQNKRDLPWRNTRDPFKIWLSEIILQQTRVDQGMPYYHRFTETFSTVTDLAKAKEELVLRLWQGLGYYSRARNLHTAAKDIVSKFGGKFPETYDELLSLKGVGDYTAAAIASFAFKKKHPVVDGNVFRLMTRYFGIHDPIDKTSTKKEITIHAGDLMEGFPPDEFNQAIMEFGAMQCKPVSPDCSVCPLAVGCFAFKNNVVDVLPVKEKKTKVRTRYFHYIVIEDKNHFYIKKRETKDIWQGLHDFPLIETEKELKEAQAKKHLSAGKYGTPAYVSDTMKHLLSHQHIYARFYHVEESSLTDKSVLKKLIRVDKKTIGRYALPRLIEGYLEKMGL